MISLKQLQEQHKDWEEKNFGKVSREDSFLGIAEEVGELAHALLKSKQGIRTNENHDLTIKDAVGDIFIYLVSFCNKMDYDLEKIIDVVWEEVSRRDWNKNPINGE